MNVWKFTQRICLIAIILLLALILWQIFKPRFVQIKELSTTAEMERQDIQREGEKLRMLKLNQEKLQEDPKFIEKIAREDLGYAKPGETVFRFVDQDKP